MLLKLNKYSTISTINHNLLFGLKKRNNLGGSDIDANHTAVFSLEDACSDFEASVLLSNQIRFNNQNKIG
ncbi:MAG: hypothetical protein LCH67_20345 [Bacteroidetes bacterium]|nr:hypothetical protein [Bacteroidota bacterium]